VPRKRGGVKNSSKDTPIGKKQSRVHQRKKKKGLLETVHWIKSGDHSIVSDRNAIVAGALKESGLTLGGLTGAGTGDRKKRPEIMGKANSPHSSFGMTRKRSLESRCA